MRKELKKVIPSEFSINLLGKEREVKFGNRALAKIEEKYGSVEAFGQVQEDLQKKPMQTVPWLLSICLRDKEGLTDDYESILDAMDDSGLTIAEVATVVMDAINSSLSVYADDEKKKQMETK
jgi:translation elongation factor EF-1beta